MKKQSSFIRIYDAEEDTELKDIDEFIDDDVINHTFSYKHTGKVGRKAIPFSVKLRMHILESIKKIPSFNMVVRETRQRRAYRRFCKISSKSKVPCAATLTNFRKELTFRDRILLMSIFIRTAKEKGLFDNCLNLHIIDSTDLESPCSAKVIKKDSNGRERYHDPTATKGRRASKKGKSKYFIGHKKHTLSIVPPDNKAIALLSFVTPAHQHDGHFLLGLLRLAEMIGLPVNYVVCDTAYIDNDKKKRARERYGVVVHTPKKGNTKLPLDVDDTGTPECPLGEPMKWLGYDFKTGLHSYGCGVEGCGLNCDVRTIRSDDYPIAFGEIPTHTRVSRELIKKRKLIESQFWRDKELYGLERLTLMNKENVHFLSVVADICGLLKSLSMFVKMRGFRKRSSFSSRGVKRVSQVLAFA